MTYVVSAPAQNNKAKFFALLWDCGTDGRVTSDVRDQYQSLVASGYTTILALRDVRPDFSLPDVPRLRAAFHTVLPKLPIQPQLFFAAQEIEAWFLAEYTHFERIDPALTVGRIRRDLQVDLITEAIELIAQPAVLLNDIYALAGGTYTKSASDAKRTVAALDLVLMRRHLPTRAPNFAAFLAALVDFFSEKWRSRLRQLVFRGN
jgi:hypothetical protein